MIEIDKFSTADYIALMDADTVLTTFGAPEIFFGRSLAGEIAPIQYGRASGGPFVHTTPRNPLHVDRFEGSGSGA